MHIPRFSYETKTVHITGDGHFSESGTTNVYVMYHYEGVKFEQDYEIFIRDFDINHGISAPEFSQEARKLGYTLNSVVTLFSGTCIDSLCVTLTLIDTVEKGEIQHSIHVDGIINIREIGDVYFNGV